jgi:predicted house-cleaning noncanonical NTP pyrophosphatase (MazG superfamily)
MIKIGDKVKFLNDVGGGVVTGFAGKDKVYVENYDGFEIPCLISQLVFIDSPGMNKAEKTETRQTRPVKSAEPEFRETPGTLMKGKDAAQFYFCFVPADSGNPLTGDVTMFLVNDSNFTLMFRFVYIKPTGINTVKTGVLQSNSKVMLSSFGQNLLSDLPEFGFQLIYFLSNENDLQIPIVKRFKLNPLKFYKETSFQFSNFFGQNAMTLQVSQNIQAAAIDKLTEEEFQKLVQHKKEEPVTEKPVQKKNEEIVEIDLHIDEIIDSTKGLSKTEILQIQKDKVESEMKLAIQTGVKKIVFIHGIGQGVLKQEVINMLKTKFKKYYFQDASFQEYGYGATMVILRKV